MSCPFCSIQPARIFLATDTVLAFWDGYPVSPGHALIATRRHVRDWFAATDTEQLAVLAALAAVKDVVEQRHRPDGYNIGINVGAAAGQTVEHVHVHVIPRYHGDVADPRGGVRHAVIGRGYYRDEPAE